MRILFPVLLSKIYPAFVMMRQLLHIVVTFLLYFTFTYTLVNYSNLWNALLWDGFSLVLTRDDTDWAGDWEGLGHTRLLKNGLGESIDR
jgi:hypothetical protein